MKWLFILDLLCFIIEINALWKPKQNTTWNYVLDGTIYLFTEKAEILDIDLHDRSSEDIQNYHDANKKVICYFSGGTLENRPDKDEFYKVDGLVNVQYRKLFDNYWLDIRKEGLKPLLRARMELAVSKKCDGIEVDNIDGYENEELQATWPNTPFTKDDAVTFAKWLASTAHELDLAIGLKNSLFMIEEVGEDFDFAINEDCGVLDEPNCYLYKNFLYQDKAVFSIFYESSMRKGNKEMCEAIKNLNMSIIVKEKKKLIQKGFPLNETFCSSVNVLKYISIIVYIIIFICVSIAIVIILYRIYISGKRKNKVDKPKDEERINNECIDI